jgi:hypothetical protein
MGKKSAPKPPDLRPLTEAQLRQAEMSNELAREHLGLSREQFDFFRTQGLEELALARQQADRQFQLQERALASDAEAQGIYRQVSAEQLRAMEQSRGWAEQDRARYEARFRPIEDQLADEAMAYDSPERREAEASRRMVDVQRQAEQARTTADSRLRGMGIDPSQIRSGSMMNQLATMTAAQAAQAGNDGRTQIEDRGRALRADAANMGRGLPSQAASSLGMSLGAGQAAAGTAGAGQGANLNAINTGSQMGMGALGARQGAIGQMAGTTGTGLQWGASGMGAMGMGSNAIMNAGNLMNSAYGNQMARWNAQTQSRNQLFGDIAGVAAAAAGAGGWAEGGAVSRSALRRRLRHMAEGGRVAPERVRAPGGIDPGEDQTAAARRQKFGEILAQVAAQGGDEPWVDYTPRNPIQQVFYAEGGQARGALPRRQSRDQIPAMLAEGEYVVPADVVSAKGIEYFDKLVAKYHRPES